MLALRKSLHTAHARVVAVTRQTPSCVWPLIEDLPRLRVHDKVISVEKFYTLATSIITSGFWIFKKVKQNVFPKSILHDILVYLSGVGEVFFYPNSSGLADSVILDPQWLTTRYANPATSTMSAHSRSQHLWPATVAFGQGTHTHIMHSNFPQNQAPILFHPFFQITVYFKSSIII